MRTQADVAAALHFCLRPVVVLVREIQQARVISAKHQQTCNNEGCPTRGPAALQSSECVVW